MLLYNSFEEKKNEAVNFNPAISAQVLSREKWKREQ